MRATQRLENRGDPATSSLLVENSKNFNLTLKWGKPRLC